VVRLRVEPLNHRRHRRQRDVALGEADAKAAHAHAVNVALRQNAAIRDGGGIRARIGRRQSEARQVAAVGHTLRSAQDAGLNVRAVDTPTEGSAGGSFVGHDAPGTAWIVVDEDRRVIVGATFTGVEVAESLHAATIAVIGEVPIERLWHAVPCFPTRSELWLNLLEAYGL